MNLNDTDTANFIFQQKSIIDIVYIKKFINLGQKSYRLQSRTVTITSNSLANSLYYNDAPFSNSEYPNYAPSNSN